MVHNTLTFPRPNIYSVGADEVAGIQSCVDYLTSRGRRQMLLVINENRVSGALIRSAFESAVKRYPHVHSTVIQACRFRSMAAKALPAHAAGTA